LAVFVLAAFVVVALVSGAFVLILGCSALAPTALATVRMMASPTRTRSAAVIIGRCLPRRARGPERTFGTWTKTTSFGPPGLAAASIARQ